MQFNYSTLRGFFDSFSAPDREVDLPVRIGAIKVQQRGFGNAARFYLRLSRGAQITYHRIERDEMLAMAEALVAFAEANPSENQTTRTPQ